MPQTIELVSTGGSMGLYVAEPAGEAQAAIVVLQEAFGVNDHIQDICRRFAAEGYLTVAPHLFHRSGDPVIDYEDMQEVMGQIMALRADGMEADLDATFAHLAGAGFEMGRIGVVGFCLGGSVSFLAAARRPVGAAVSFYGGGIAEGRFGIPPLVELATQLECPWLGLFGDQDQTIRVDQVEALRVASSRAPVPTEVVRYPEADHGFHCDARSSYHEASAKDAWQRTLEWFARYVARS
jgi:carboxymethylenebutenolidase